MLSAIICDKNKSGREQLYRLLNSIYRGKVDILGEFDSIEVASKSAFACGRIPATYMSESRFSASETGIEVPPSYTT